MMIEVAINISEGRNRPIINLIAQVDSVLDIHSDPDHNRSVITLAANSNQLQLDIRQLVKTAIENLDITTHQGEHPRFGVVDVVPFIDLENDHDLSKPIEQRNNFAQWVGTQLKVPCFLYGPHRSLPQLRKGAFIDFGPDFGPLDPHRRAGSIAVGARGILIAYNLWLSVPDIDTAKMIAKQIRSKDIRALGIKVGDQVQVSLNLINPYSTGPEKAYDLVRSYTSIARAELVGLLPRKSLYNIDPTRWEELDLSLEKTIESKIALSK